MNRRLFISTTGCAALGLVTVPSLVAADQTYYEHGRCSSYALPTPFGCESGVTIQRVETYHQSGTIAFCHVVMSDGSEGWGQISTYDADISATLLHRKIAPHVLGKDPAMLDSLVDQCTEANYKWPWSYVCRALGGFDTAVWDWIGKREGKSVCALLGGTPRPYPVYGSSMRRDISPADEGKRLKALRDEKGFTAFKIRVGKEAGHDGDASPGRTEAIIPAVRKAVGDKILLLADGNSCYTPPKAIKVGKQMQEQNYYCFEEPCPYWEYEWTREVTKALRMKVSGGEQDNDLAGWRRMIEMDAVDIVQPDILYMGGITRTLRVATMASEKKKLCIPHSANLGMVTLFSLHVLGAISNSGGMVEFSIENTPWTEGLYSPALEVKEGMVAIPNAPGWGVTVNPAWLEKAERQVSEVKR